MAKETSGEQTESATPRRREEARREGRVARSTELTSALVLLTGIVALSSFGGGILRKLSDVTRVSLGTLAHPALTPQSVIQLFQHFSIQMLFILLPFLLTVVAVGITSNVLQVGIMATSQTIMPRWSILNPIEGFKRIFSLRSLTELAKAIAKITVIGGVAYLTVSADLKKVVPLEGADVGGFLKQVGSGTVRLGLRTGFALLALAVLDYGYQRWEFERSMRMSRQEIEEEQKQMEGDPRVKARVRLVQRMLARRRMMTDVAAADVIVTNPTHVAVALKYDRLTMAAPVLVAKGMRKVAEKIKEIARENRVPIVEDPPLARLLYKEGRIGQTIPVELYRAVAQVLAHVWRLRQRAAGSGGRS